MINTVLERIERFESYMGFEMSPELDLSSELETSILPVTAYEHSESDDTSVQVDTEEDTSDDSDDYKDNVESPDGEKISFQTDPVHIRQTLKDKIRIRRESEGCGELINLFEPPVQYKLTEEEELKNEQRKQRNRRSANKSRLKRIAYEQKLEKDASELEEEHAKLTKEIDELKKRKLLYHMIYKQHVPSCLKIPDALKQLLNLRKTIPVADNLPAIQAKGVQNEIVGPNTNPMLTSHRDSKPPEYSNLHFPMKRENLDGLSVRPSNVQKLCNPSLQSNLNIQLGEDSMQTCMNSGFDDSLYKLAAAVCQTRTSDIGAITTRISSQDNTQCEIPSINCTTIQSHFSGAIHNHTPPVYSSVVSTADNMVTKDVYSKTNGTEEQRINQIKEHLLDGFQMTSDR